MFRKAWLTLCLIVIGFVGGYAQYVNGDLEIKDRTLQFADSILRSEKVLFSPSAAADYLADPVTTTKKSAFRHGDKSQKSLSADQLYDRSKTAVAWLAMCYRKRPGGMPDLNQASAFVVTPDGVCLTNYHVLFAYASDKGMDGSGVLLIRAGNGKVYQVEKVLGAWPEDDLAVLQLAIDPGEKLPYLIIEPDPARVGQDIYVLGSPKDIYYVLSKGIVSSKYANNMAWPNNKGRSVRDLLAITADFAIGASGSPVLNEKGKVLGMVSSTRVIEQRSTGYPLSQMVIKNAIPNGTLIRYLKSLNVY